MNINQDPSLLPCARSKDRPQDVIVDMVYIHKIENNSNYLIMDYSRLHFQGHWSRGIYRVNEHLAVVISIICNCLVIAVFVRILGLARLPSRILVSMALANIAFALSQSLHTASVSMKQFADSVHECRIITMVLTNAWTLQFNGLAAAIMERILACNSPSFYNCNINIIDPAILITPWMFWTINLMLIIVQFYNFDLGYECSSHMNTIEPIACMYTTMESSLLMVFALFGVLGISFLLHENVSYDVLDANRIQFEYRTTIAILQVALLNLVFALPSFAYTKWMQPGGITNLEAETLHLVNQFSTHLGMSLICVLLCRQEFRRSIPLIFQGRAAIARTRTLNLLVNHPGSDNRSLGLKLNKALSESRPEPRGPLSSQRTSVSMRRSNTPTAASEQQQSPMRSREILANVETPKWLQDKQNSKDTTPAPTWHLVGFFDKWFKNESTKKEETVLDDTGVSGTHTREASTADHSSHTGTTEFSFQPEETSLVEI